MQQSYPGILFHRGSQYLDRFDNLGAAFPGVDAIEPEIKEEM